MNAIEKKIREAADLLVDAARQLEGRVAEVEDGLAQEKRRRAEREKQFGEELKHIRDQSKLTYEAIDLMLKTMKADEHKHEEEEARHEHQKDREK